ncbi:hypothetical protein Aph01nite_08340 [Acrocarpospora phusangensis]|uniref:Uncharacterized protein n=1 Tax=Acrocarpospora phusangensis TaxID=1070424 RepID=A0A919Q795_9ACTN|nr:hypothetical protein [Acrocarpospora phusangensis]GIH22524.1 hypothetical protein Aph01nite_08340 [Acrocarpospora phusangensis]
MPGKGSFRKQQAEAAKILTKRDRFSATRSRIDEVARSLRHEGRDAAEARAAEIYNDPYYGI